MKTKQTVSGFPHSLDFSFVLRPVLAVLLLIGLGSPAHAGPEGGIVRAGSAQIIGQGNTTLIQQNTSRAIIDWRSFGINANEQVQFAQPSARSAILNRVTGEQVSLILGRMDANGQVLLVNPNGIIFGKGAQINVGSLIASTANISNDNFMQEKLVFDQPGKPGAGIINSGSINAMEGGLVALVAPHVRNDGLIQARLGKVVMGAADTFTIDLYGDGLLNLALSEESLAQLVDTQGQPIKDLVSQAGTIDVGGGQTVLVTADAARGVLDSLINMSGTILADSAVQEGGRIVLLARGGNVEVSGELSATGTTGGQIDVLGDQVHLASTAKLNADGADGGGTLHIGGACQGSGDTYRAEETDIDAGATLQASASTRGDGGEVVVWSNGGTAYEGSILARGGKEAGDGGRVEVSGKQSLLFDGLVDAGAANGRTGSLLLDPYNFTIGMSEAGIIDRVLRTGTSTSVSADNDIYVNYAIDGRGRYAGGGLTLSAGHDIDVNDHILTYNGTINLFAGTGTVTVAPDKVVYAGTAPITVRTGADLYNASYLTGSLLSLTSTQGSVYINQGIESSIGDLLIDALLDVNINEPIVSLSDGDSVTITADNDVNINAQIDGRPALDSAPYGSVTMTAGQDILLNKSILAHSIFLTANNGTIEAPTMKDGTVTIQPNGIPLGEGLFAGDGPISVTAGANLSAGVYVTTGPVVIRSTGGDVTVDTKLAEILGNVTIKADSGSVHVDQEIANIRSGHDLEIIAGTDINLDRQIDALDDTNPLSITPVPGGSVTFTAGNDVNLNQDLATYDGSVEINADIAGTTGTLNIAWNDNDTPLDTTDDRTCRIQTGSAPISVTTGGNLTTGTATPTSATLFPNPWDPTYLAGLDYTQPESYTAAQTAMNDYFVNVLPDELTRYVAFCTTGKLSLTSTGGNVTVTAPIPDTTGGGEITADNAITVNQHIFSNNKPITLIAGLGGITVNDVDGSYDIDNGLPPSNPNYIALVPGAAVPTIAACSENNTGLNSTIDSNSSGDLTLVATGDIAISTSNGIAVGGKLAPNSTNEVGANLTIQAGGKILQGTVNPHWKFSPSEIELVADGGIDSFNAGYAGKISATSSAGSINLGVDMPGTLTINAGLDVFTGGFIGSDVDITAGRDINLSDVSGWGGTELVLNAGRNANLNSFNIIHSLDVTAGGDIYFSPGYAEAPGATIWLAGGGLTATSLNGSINFGSATDYSAIHIDGGKGLVLDAGESVELGLLESRGPVSITAGGDIILRNDIGPPIQYYIYVYSDGMHDLYAEKEPSYSHDPGTWNLYKYKYTAQYGNPPITEIRYTNDTSDPAYTYTPSFDPNGDGVASLALNAGGNITTQGVKAAGLVTITTDGYLDTYKGIFSGTSGGVSITATGGAWESKSGGDVFYDGPFTFTGTSFGDIPLPAQRHLLIELPVIPGVSPGPAIVSPGAALAMTALPAAPPGLASVSGSDVPAGSGLGAERQFEPERATGDATLSEIIPETEEESSEETEQKKDEETVKEAVQKKSQEKAEIVLEFSGGRGVSQTAVDNEIRETFIQSPFVPPFSRRR